MNTHRFTFAARNRVGRMALAMLSSILLALTLLFSPVAFATSVRATTPSLPTLSPANVLNLAGVSVVRLSLTYSATQSTTVKTVFCTALGSLIASWPASSPTDQNNWVVTDGSLLSLQNSSCQAGSLTQIQILANTLYTNANSHLSLLDTLTCKTAGCQDQQSDSTSPVPETLLSPAIGGGVLFSFHTPTLDMQPFLTLGSSQASSSSLGIELENPGSPPPWPPTPLLTSSSQAQSFLTPLSSSASPPSPASTATPGGSSGGTATKFEPGMPFVDSQGAFVGMQVSRSTTPFTLTNLQALESKVPAITDSHPPNLLQVQWDAGMQAFDRGDYATAKSDFAAILDSTRVNNPAFQAASNFEQQAATKQSQLGGQTPTPSVSGTPGGKGLASSSNTLFLVIGLAAGVIFLVLLLVLVSLIFGRRRASRRSADTELDRFKEEAAAARRQAPLEAQRINEEAQRRRNQPSDNGVPYAQAVPPAPFQMSPAPPLQMSPSAPPLPPAPPPASAPHAPAAAPQPQQEQWQQPQTDYAFADPLDTPTVPMNRKNGSGSADARTNEGQLVREFHNVSLAVGSLSNVGLKRQHKPNEDSMFAIQAARTYDSKPQQFGLFVIADGMGGHANGGDASRTAIQTMIDFMLPKISVAEPGMSDQDYLKLLEEGVQHANYAVHQRNLQDHADMGTTMTGALVVGAMAYVANVGDSRTYLFRHSTGLTKVTRDHSVVASLVDAGIIKPDDIYTHPKRNQIYRSLGEKPVVEVDSFPVELQAGDKLLLCSDGLWDLVRDPDIQRIIASTETNPAQTSDELIQAALKGGGDDNVSVIVVSITEIDGHTGLSGINYLAKPDSVTVPDLPTMP